MDMNIVFKDRQYVLAQNTRLTAYTLILRVQMVTSRVENGHSWRDDVRVGGSVGKVLRRFEVSGSGGEAFRVLVSVNRGIRAEFPQGELHKTLLPSRTLQLPGFLLQPSFKEYQFPQRRLRKYLPGEYCPSRDSLRMARLLWSGAGSYINMLYSRSAVEFVGWCHWRFIHFAGSCVAMGAYYLIVPINTE